MIFFINISLKSVSEGPINNILASVQIMAWRRPGDKQLSEPMMVRLPTHMCVTRPQSINVETHKLMRASEALINLCVSTLIESLLWVDSHNKIRNLALN